MDWLLWLLIIIIATTFICIVTPHHLRDFVLLATAGALIVASTGPPALLTPPPAPAQSTNWTAPPRALLQPAVYLAQQHLAGQDGRDEDDWLGACGEEVSRAVDLMWIEGAASPVYHILSHGYSLNLRESVAQRRDHHIRPSRTWHEQPGDHLSRLRGELRRDCHDGAHSTASIAHRWTRPLRCLAYRLTHLPRILATTRYALTEARAFLPRIEVYYNHTRTLIRADLHALEEFRKNISSEIAEPGHLSNEDAKHTRNTRKYARYEQWQKHGAEHTLEAQRALYLLSVLHSARLSALLNFIDDLQAHYLTPFIDTLRRGDDEILHVLNGGNVDALLHSLQRLVLLEADYGYFPPTTADTDMDRTPLVVPPRLQDKYLTEWLIDFWCQNPLPPASAWQFPPPPPSLLYQLQRFLDQSTDLTHRQTTLWWQSYWQSARVRLSDPTIWCKSVIEGSQEVERSNSWDTGEKTDQLWNSMCGARMPYMKEARGKRQGALGKRG